MKPYLHSAILAGCLTFSCFDNAFAQSVEKNHIYAMASGSAMLLDVYYPAADKTRNKGVVFIPGSGWYADSSYSAKGLKEMQSGWQPGDQLAKTIVSELVDAGFTVFVPNHRASPEFHYPVPEQDIAQAVAYIRANAVQYNIESERIGGAGTSSGGSLVSMMGVNDEFPNKSRLQAIVTLGSPMDLPSLYSSSAGSAGNLATYIGHSINFLPEAAPEYQVYVQASTSAHISPGDAPHLLIHGDRDELVPVSQSREVLNQFKELDIHAAKIEVPGGKHSENLVEQSDIWLPSLIDWFEDNL